MVPTSTASSFSLQSIPKSFSCLICKEQVLWFSFSSRPTGVGHVEHPKKLQWAPPAYLGNSHGLTTSTGTYIVPEAVHWTDWVIMQLLLLCTSPQESCTWKRLFPFPCASPALLAGQHVNQMQSSEQSHLHKPGLTPQKVLALPGTTSWKIWMLLARDNFQALSALVMNWIPAPLSL